MLPREETELNATELSNSASRHFVYDMMIQVWSMSQTAEENTRALLGSEQDEHGSTSCGWLM